ncbi:hypothetical protein PFISCL1PPCAC_3465, partial [Pristionchus fissidentatus]
ARWLRELSEQLFFRRLMADQLLIICTASEPVKESVLESVTSQFDFRVFYLEFYSRNYQSVLNFALRSKKCIDRFTISSTSFSPDPHDIIQLPRMSHLCVKGMTPGFSDHQAIEIARKEHTASLIWSDLSHTTTLRRLIQKCPLLFQSPTFIVFSLPLVCVRRE